MPANPFAEGMSVKVGGDTSGATRALSSLGAKLTSVRGLALGLGGVLAGALAVKGLGAAVSAAADFETAMVEVEKVTDAETAAALSGRMRELSKEIPITAEELAGLAADAARFGVRGTENIEEFTTSVAKMATATDLTAQQSGEAFARLSKLTDTPVGDVENLGSSINELSNNMATSAGEIVDSMLRSSAALSQFGLNNTEIVGMSAALNEVSESSRRAGTRLRRVAQELMNPRKVADIADALGMNVEEFKNMRRERPAELMMMLAEAFAEGDERAEALRGTLSTASRQAIAGMAQNLDGLREALGMSKEAFEENTSVQKEFDAATDTFNARLQTFRNRLNDVGIEIGNKLLPHLSNLLDDFQKEGGLVDSIGTFLTDLLTEANIKKVADFGKDLGQLVDPASDLGSELGDLVGNAADFVIILSGGDLGDTESNVESLAEAMRRLADALEDVNEGWAKFNRGLESGTLAEDPETGSRITFNTADPRAAFDPDREFGFAFEPRGQPRLGFNTADPRAAFDPDREFGFYIEIVGDTEVVKDATIKEIEKRERRAARGRVRGAR